MVKYKFKFMEHKFFSVILIMTMMLSLLSIFTGPIMADPPTGSTRTQTFNDDFNGTSLDTSKWNPNSWGIAADDASTLMGYAPGQITVGSGLATIKTEKKDIAWHLIDNTPVTRHYTSGWMNTHGKWSQRFGFFESRIQLARGQGMYGDFWMVAQNNIPYAGMPLPNANWPPEIDILESAPANQTEGARNNYHLGFFYNSNNYPSNGGGTNGIGNPSTAII